MKSRHEYSFSRRLYRDLTCESCPLEPGAARAARGRGESALFVAWSGCEKPGAGLTKTLANVLAPASGSSGGIAASETRFRGFGRQAQFGCATVSNVPSEQIIVGPV